MLPGQEAIVVLDLINHRLDDDFDYLNLDLSQNCSAGILRIDGSTVIDPNRYWSTTGSLTYSEFLTRFENLKLAIIAHYPYDRSILPSPSNDPLSDECRLTADRSS